MIRLFVLASIIFLSCIYAQNGTDRKIEETSEQIKSFDKQYLSLNKKMAETARAILVQKKAILKSNMRSKKFKYLMEQYQRFRVREIKSPPPIFQEDL
jgi:hypothetical protein